jgi:hypothetical protein
MAGIVLKINYFETTLFMDGTFVKAPFYPHPPQLDPHLGGTNGYQLDESLVVVHPNPEK